MSQHMERRALFWLRKAPEEEGTKEAESVNVGGSTLFCFFKLHQKESFFVATF